ncbi:MAG: GntR family transcriptional regulator [Candidatus Marinimicrobia bacterium]|nr:GntR family transcriptional regulator [Candidatus Neomarinimicrobiota bacterium]
MIIIDQDSRIPKYRQIVQEIIKNIKNGELKYGDRLPSINELKSTLDVARDTVVKAYKKLNATGVISSMPGKGYYISKNIPDIKHRIFLLFDLFLPYKRTILNSFLEHIGDHVLVDVYFHHYNKNLYKKLILEALGKYTDYVIMPLEEKPEQQTWFNHTLGKQNTYILDVGLKEYGYKYPSVCQDFRKSWYHGLAQVSSRLRKYDELVLVEYKAPMSQYSAPHDLEMVRGFNEFCRDFKFKSRIIRNIEEAKVEKNKCYVVSDDDDLVMMMLEAREKGFEPGQNVGFISHNDEPLKSIAGKNGIATISTDFYEMGKKMAEMITSGDKQHHINPSGIMVRDSI